MTDSPAEADKIVREMAEARAVVGMIPRERIALTTVADLAETAMEQSAAQAKVIAELVAALEQARGVVQLWSGDNINEGQNEETRDLDLAPIDAALAHAKAQLEE